MGKGRSTIPIEKRFWEKVNKKQSQECWEWIAYTHPKGYGQICHNGKPKRAHRVSWEIHYGEIPDGVCVLHRCDNPSCVNPEHLWLGTNLDNMRDMINKGRDVHESPQVGINHWNSKLDENKVIKIRKLYSTKKCRYIDLAKMFGVHKVTIGDIVRRTTWTHV